MAETPPVLQLIEVEADGYCDAETGVCAVPAAAETPPREEPEAEVRSGSGGHP